MCVLISRSRWIANHGPPRGRRVKNHDLHHSRLCVRNLADSFQHPVLSMLALPESGNQLTSDFRSTGRIFWAVLVAFNDFSFTRDLYLPMLRSYTTQLCGRCTPARLRALCVAVRRQNRLKLNFRSPPEMLAFARRRTGRKATSIPLE